MGFIKKIISTDAQIYNQAAFLLLVIVLPFTPLSAALALALGLFYTALFGNPWVAISKKMVSWCLGLAIIGLGAGMDLVAVASVGMRGIGYTLFTITLTLCLALLFGHLFKLDKSIAMLLGVGTAICGGSAIAAASGTIRAKPEEISVAMATVFMLNAIALYIFPSIGKFFGLSQMQFGLWSALAIHDTSSVVAASMRYGEEALTVGTTVKLARALWIAPLTMILALFWPKTPGEKRKAAFVPWFIVGFLVSAGLGTFIPGLSSLALLVAASGKRLLVLALFLVGANISLQSLKAVGPRAFFHGALLWILVSIMTLVAIYTEMITL